PVVAFRDIAFEGSVVEWMIFHFHGESLARRIEARSFWNGPTDQHAIHFETEIVVQTCRVVALHAKEARTRSLFGCTLFRRRLGGPLKVPFARVFFQAHRHLHITAKPEFANLEYTPGSISF